MAPLSLALPFPPPASLPPKYTLSRCTPPDVPSMTQCYISAFHPGDFDYWWPADLSTMRRWTEQRFALRLLDATDRQFKIVDSESGEVVSFVRWGVPAAMEGMSEGFRPFTAEEIGIEDAETKKESWVRPEGADEELYREFFRGITGMHAKWGAKEKLDLSLLCTRPAHQGRGLAAALLKPVLALADRHGLTTYVEALDNAKPVYLRYGFKPVDRLEYDLTKAGREGKAVIHIMLREPVVAN